MILKTLILCLLLLVNCKCVQGQKSFPKDSVIRAQWIAATGNLTGFLLNVIFYGFKDNLNATLDLNGNTDAENSFHTCALFIKDEAKRVVRRRKVDNEEMDTRRASGVWTFDGGKEMKGIKSCVIPKLWRLVSTLSQFMVATNNTALDCPSLDKGDSFTQSEFLSRLANECRYDRLLLPTYQTADVVYVHASAYVYFIQPAEAHDLNFKLHFLLQLRWTDPRLAYTLYSPERTKIIGESDLRQRIWVPHLYMSNEQSSSLMGTDSKDVLISIAPDGEVLFSRRMQAVLYCWMNLQKFPFDDQTCSMNLESWKYNASILRLMWERDNPVRLSSELHLTEYSLIDYWTNESVVRGDILNMRLGGAGNYSALKFTFKLGREVGYYLMDYFIPSMMIVATSWVTFWLQADASAPRITLGTSTMLSFITLASSQAKTLPKVSYIKASEIWFLGCTGFIFSALVEFAFVNTIWRRKKVVTMKKVNSKYILKSTLTPRLARKELQKELQNSSPQLTKSRSCSSLNQETSSDPAGPGYNNYLTVHSFPSALNLPTITTQSYDELISGRQPASEGSDEPPKHHTWTTMTPQEIATWIDKRSRVLFPLLFLFFNIIYWTFVYCL